MKDNGEVNPPPPPLGLWKVNLIFHTVKQAKHPKKKIYMFTYAVVSRLVELKSEKDSNEKMGKRRCMVEACGKKKKIQRWAQSMKVFESYANIHK